MAIPPGSRVTLTLSQLRRTSSRHWDIKKYATVLATQTSGDWNPPPDDPSLTIDENKKNLLIRRALKWPLLTSGYESPESFDAARTAQIFMDASLYSYSVMHHITENYCGEYVVNEFCRKVLHPARLTLDAAVAELRQPALVPSRSGPAAFTAAPARPVPTSTTKNTAAAVVAQEQQGQSPRKKTPAQSSIQPPVLSSSDKATASSIRPQQKLGKSPAKAPSVKTSPAKTCQPQPIIPFSSKAPTPAIQSQKQSEKLPAKASSAKTSPAKTSLPTAELPPSSNVSLKKMSDKSTLPPPDVPSSKGTPKKTPVTAAPAKSSQPPPGKAPVAVVSNSQTQPKTAKITPAKSSPAKKPNRPPSVATSLVEVSAEASESPKRDKRLSETLSANSPFTFTKAEIAAVNNKVKKLASAKRLRAKQCLPPSPTSTSPSEVESSCSSRSSSRSPTPSPPEPHVRTAAKGKATKIISREIAPADSKLSRPSSPVKVNGGPRQTLEAGGSPSAPPRTPKKKDMRQGLIEKFKEVESSLQKVRQTELIITGQVAQLGQLFHSYVEVSDAGTAPGPCTSDED